MIISVHENLCYSLDSPMLVSEVQLETNPAKKREKQIKSIVTFWDNPPIVIGEIKLEFHQPCKLHNFASPITQGEKTLEKGTHKLALVNINVPRHLYLRNIDLVLVPRTHFGLAYSGLVTFMSVHNRMSQEDWSKFVLHVGREMFELTHQFELPFRDSS
jgi:hypothetical protein